MSEIIFFGAVFTSVYMFSDHLYGRSLFWKRCDVSFNVMRWLLNYLDVNFFFVPPSCRSNSEENGFGEPDWNWYRFYITLGCEPKKMLSNYITIQNRHILLSTNYKYTKRLRKRTDMFYVYLFMKIPSKY